MNYHSPFVRKLRSFARKYGFLKFLKKGLHNSQKSYEENFHAALQNAVSNGDVVWDIGANVGLYTKYFLDWSGTTGKVVAFEPLPNALKSLQENIKTHPSKDNAILRPVALSDSPGKAFFLDTSQGNKIATTAHLMDKAERKGNETLVEVSTVDAELQEIKEQPNVVKIDVEGFEEDVLKGGNKTFSSPACKHILIEMHFTRMDERNLGDSASRIVSMLKKWGYRITWVDPSHLQASRN